MAGMPSWVLLLVLAAVLTWVAATLLARVNPGEPIPVVGSPPVVPGLFLLLLCGAVVCGWLAGSYASEGPLGPGGYLVGALGVATPWGLVVLRHNRASR